MTSFCNLLVDGFAFRQKIVGNGNRQIISFHIPGEFVDLTHEDLRYDCRFRTGDVALQCLREVIRLFQRRGARFLTMRELDPAAAAAA